MAKHLGITCDLWKVEKFRKRLLERGFTLDFDDKLTPEGNVHLFRVICEDEDFHETALKLESTLRQLEIEVKQSN